MIACLPLALLFVCRAESEVGKMPDTCLLQAGLSLHARSGVASQGQHGLLTPNAFALPRLALTDKQQNSLDAPVFAWGYILVCFTAGPLLWAIANVASPLSKGPKPEKSSPQVRIAYLDWWRILCVLIMVASHAGSYYQAYIDYNALYGQEWVLPIIMLISGTCYAKSSMPLIHYTARLLTYFAVGNFLNWGASVITGTRWWEELFTRGVTFQMFFVLGLAGGIVATAPLKSVLVARAADEERHSTISLQSIGFACFFLGCVIVYWFSGLSSVPALKVSDRPFDVMGVVREVGESSMLLLIATLSVDVLPSKHCDLIGWFLLAWIEGTRIARQEVTPGSEIHLCDLFMFAVFVHFVPLRQSRRIGMFFAQAWTIPFMLAGFLIAPGVDKRMDLFPSEYMNIRARYYAVELMAVLAFTTIPTAGLEYTVPLPDVLRRNMGWATNWALFAYCAHYAIYRLILGAEWSGKESTTAGPVLVLSAALVFYALEGRKGSGGGAGDKLAQVPLPETAEKGQS